MDTRTKHLKAIADEIKRLRGWLDYLERDVTSGDQGVVSAVILTSINESCMSLIYNAGIANGAALAKYDEPKTEAEAARG